VASEDSDQCCSRLAVIHRLRHLGDLDQSRASEVPTGSNDFHTPCERLEIGSLGSAERMLLEERNDPLQQLGTLTHVVLKEDARDGCRVAG
jgi:hypothetical protein